MSEAVTKSKRLANKEPPTLPDVPPPPRIGPWAYLLPCLIQLTLLMTAGAGLAAILWLWLRPAAPATPTAPAALVGAELRPAGPVKAEVPEELTADLRKAQAEIEQLRQRMHDEQLRGEQRRKQLLALVVEVLSGQEEEGPAGPTALAPVIDAKPQDVLVAAVLSDNLKYERDCEVALREFFSHFEQANGHRVGLAFVRGAEVTSRVGLEQKGELRFSLFRQGGGTSGVSEALGALVGTRLGNLFGTEAKAPRRIVVLASWQCFCPEKEWDGVDARVDVVLVRDMDVKGSKADQEKWDSVKKNWREFCRKRGGTCREVPASQQSPGKALVTRMLQELARPVRELPLRRGAP